MKDLNDQQETLIKIMTAGFNAIVGRGKVGKTIEDFGLGERNERGDLLQFNCVKKTSWCSKTLYFNFRVVGFIIG